MAELRLATESLGLAEAFGVTLTKKFLLGAELVDLAALAQHHGVPTRLLDWPRRGEVATFFATEGDPVGRHVVVWALRIDEPGELFSAHHPTRHGNEYLHAQEGVVTQVPKGNDFFGERGRWPALEELVWPATPGGSVLQRFRLPAGEVPALRQLLHAEGLSRAHLMPSYENIARTLSADWMVLLDHET